MAVEQQWVVLRPGVPVRLHLVDDVEEDRLIRDQRFNRDKTVRGLVFAVDQVDGQASTKEWSVINQRLRALLTPYLPGKAYRNFEFTVTQLGTGFMADYRLEVQPFLLGG